MNTTAGYERITIGSAMHRGVVTCRPETPLAKVAQMMAGHNIHCVVVSGETFWGVVSDLDLAGAIAAGRPQSDAEAVASTPVVTIRPDETVRRGAELMVEHGVTHLVVVRRKRPVGVISALDLARVLADLRPTRPEHRDEGRST